MPGTVQSGWGYPNMEVNVHVFERPGFDPRWQWVISVNHFQLSAGESETARKAETAGYNYIQQLRKAIDKCQRRKLLKKE